MLNDVYSGQHTSTSTTAVAAFERAVAGLGKHRPFGADLDAALAHDPALVGAHALRGISQVLLASQQAVALSRHLVKASRAALEIAGGGTAGEQALVEAHELAANGRLKAAAARLEQHLANHPRDFLSAKLAHALRFMSGEPNRMLATTSAILPHWSAGMAGYGHLLGCHAFGLEETGDLASAERTGRAAVACEPHDVWGLHAVAHVMEMRGETTAGTAWLEPTAALWTACGSFGFHLAWHLALFRLAAGDNARALALYDAHLVPSPGADFRDVANAVSMLWRLEQDGIDTGDRWDFLAAIAEQRRSDTTYVFGSLHYLIALVASDDLAAANDVVEALRCSARSRDTDQAEVSARVGVRLAEVIIDMTRRGASRADIAVLARRLPELGGSNAQRDVFLRTLLLIAAGAGDVAAVSTLTDLRLQQRRVDRFHDLVSRRLRHSPALRKTTYAAGAAW